MLELTSIYLTTAILAIMIFFSFVIAPVTFTTLDEENARKFIRKIFPFYYNVNLALSLIVTLIFVILKSYNLNFYLILTVAVLFFLSNFTLMPLINRFRDEKKDKQFKYTHFLSVIINFVQILLLLIILILN
tara:strand:+ start:1421 stop:1816 length:396 start_codon:yes stop_codon:yes gene_type:complete